MALYYELPVFKDVYSLTLRVFETTQHFSREYKFTLGQDMKRDCITLVRSIYRANKHKERTTYLEQFLDDFEVLKLEIRLCKDLRLITVKQQAQLALGAMSNENRMHVIALITQVGAYKLLVGD